MHSLILFSQIIMSGPADPSLNRADILFSEGLFQDAISLYSQQLESDSKEKDPVFLRLRLAQCYFECENDAAIIELLASPIQSEELYFLGHAYKKLGRYEEAVAIFQTYLNSSDPVHHATDAKLELGISYYLSGKTENAKVVLTSLSRMPTAKLYLAKIAISEDKPQDAEKILIDLSKNLPPEDSIQWELAYELGNLYFQSKDYAKAASSFEKALPKNRPENSPWYLNTMLKFGQSYLNIANSPQSSTADQLTAFDKAEVILSNLSLKSPCDEANLKLGECYLQRGSALHDETYLKKGNDLLAKEDRFSSLESKAQALLLRAEAAEGFSDRDRLYRELTDRMGLPKGWLLRGYNEVNEGDLLGREKKMDEARILYERAIETFSQGYLALKNDHPQEAAEALKGKAIANSRLDTVSSLRSAIDTLDLIAISDMKKDPDEILFLKGLFASRLLEKNAPDAPSPEKFLQEGLQLYPKGSHAPAALLLLGSLSLKKGDFNSAETIFKKIGEEFPNSPEAGEAWFWAAAAAESLQRDPEIIRRYKQQVFEKFPSCKYAAESYLTLYPYADYFEGSRASIKHLQGMPSKFPGSPLLINAYYLIGLDAKKDRRSEEGRLVRHKNLTAAIDAFEQAEATFDALNEKKSIPSDDYDNYVHLRYRAVLERALANFAIAEQSQGAKRQIYLEYAEEVFRSILKDFQSGGQFLVQPLYKSSPYPRIYQESEFWLAKTLINQNNDAAAEQILSSMLEKYQSVKMTRSDYLSRTWFEKGQIAMRSQNYRDALRHFRDAEEAGKGNMLTTDQRLELLIRESDCYRAMNQLENAMRILSQVINDDSISGLRIKAMFLRAEIYELQDRRELARKQLQAAAKKGGDWSLKAKEKLDKEYGYH